MPANEEVFCETSGHFQTIDNCKDSLTMFANHFPKDMDIIDKGLKSMEDLFIKQDDSTFYQSTPSKAVHENFFRNFFEIILQDAIFQGTARKTKVVEWVDPKDLPSIINLNVDENGTSHKELLELARSIIKYSVKTGHPRFVNQLFSSVDPYGLVGQWLTDALNPSVYTYEVTPVFTLMENEILREMRKIVGWKDGNGDGIFCPGGSMANGYAINLARYYKFPNLKETGLAGSPRLIIFTSEDAHYSVKKMAAFLGIGTNNVYSIKVDNVGKMSIDDLIRQIEKALDEGAVPLMVSATAGTTVLGVYDPLKRIHEICVKYNMWLHVDAAWGGGALMSATYRKYLDSIELADSITWNPHKLLAAPQQCSTLLIKHENLLQLAHSSNATYLFQKDKFYDTTFDSGDKHVQCGRRADVLKFWFMWKAKGTSGFELHVNKVMQLSRFFTDLIRNREERMVKKGSMLVTYQPIRGQPNFFRLVIQNSSLTEADMKYFVNEFEVLSEDL
ncbi:hypothetical protein PV326_008217 [Microctonus aethiopoides]|nr:hypothetical protein PV326_008217 [Microctonus aethiopoides]